MAVPDDAPIDRLELLQLNFHHLRYFWVVAREGHLTRAAQRLRVAPSALSNQIGQLEAHLGEALFLREGRTLTLTEAGRLVLAYADPIFATGSALLATFRSGRRASDPLRIGASATLSRNFLVSFLQPLAERQDVPLRLVSGPVATLLPQLADHQLDAVLTNQAVPSPSGAGIVTQRLARQAVSLIGPPHAPLLKLPEDLQDLPLLVPSPESGLRVAFDAWCHQQGVAPRRLAEVDDMALARLLARDHQRVALLPSVVVRDELRVGQLRELARVPGLVEDFFAVTRERRFPHPLLPVLLSRDLSEHLG